MPLASAPAKARFAATKARQPIASSSAPISAPASAHPTAASARSRVPPASHPSSHDAQSQPRPPSPPQLQLPPALPTIADLQTANEIAPSPQLIAARLTSLARSFLTVHPDSVSPDPLDWELDLCSATFFASYAVCLDPSSTFARRTLARCARLGGFNIVLPLTPSGSAASATVSATTLSSHDPHDVPGAHACIHILQQGSASTFQDPDSAREYRDANRVLGRASDAAEVLSLLNDKVLGKRKAADASGDQVPPAQPVPTHTRFASQLQTDVAHAASARNRTEEARSAFVSALEQDPFNWRAWTGLCDTGYGFASASQHLGQAALDRLYSKLTVDVQAPYASMEAALKTMPSFSVNGHVQQTGMVRKVSEDGSNKKFKVSSDAPAVPPIPVTTGQPSAKPTGKLTPPLPTTSATSVNATRLHPSSRALSAAQTNTHHLDLLSADQDDFKATKVATVISRPTRNAGVRTATVNEPATTQNGRQLRSTAQRTGQAAAAPTAAARARPASAVQGRTGAISQAGSVSSTSSSSTASSVSSRATASTARTAVSARRVGAAATAQPASRAGAVKVTAGRSDVAANGTGNAARRAPTSTAPRSTAVASLSRPGSAMSKASFTSVGGPSTSARVNGALASTRTAADAMRQKEEETARAKLNELVALRETCVQRLTALAHQHAADRYILALLAHVGEAYRLLRLCEGSKAAAVLMQPVLPLDGLSALGKEALAAHHIQTDEQQDDADEVSLITSTPEPTRLLDLQVRDSLIHHLLLGRSYAECAQYASAEAHFAAVRKANPYVASHMDIYSLVLFHLSREVQLSVLAQQLAMVAPGAAATHIVAGNAFSLQKEHQTALVCFQRAAAAAPEYAYAYTLAGHEAHDLGLHDEAVAYFRSAIRCDRRHWNAWAGLGRVYLGIGGHEHAACKSLQQAIHINPTNQLLWDLVGWTFALVRAPAKALECYDRAIELAPAASVLTYLRRAELLLQQGEVEASHRDLVCAHDLAPEEASIHILLAQSFMRLGGGAFCHLETPVGAAGPGASKSASAMRASGVMALPEAFHAEISHHLSVAVDLDPSLLRVVKSICEGYKTLPGSKLSVHAHDLTATSFTNAHTSGDPGLSHYDPSRAELEVRAEEYAQMSGFGSFRHHSSLMANSTPQHPQLLAPADFASTHPANFNDSSSFLSLQTPASTSDIVLEDADL